MYNKKALLRIVIVIVFCISLYNLFSIKKAEIVVQDISFIDYSVTLYDLQNNFNDKDMFGISEYDTEQLIGTSPNLKVFRIENRIKNPSFFRTLHHVQFEYVPSDQTTKLIVGSKLSESSVNYIDIPPRKTESVFLVGLVNADDYSNDEIIEQLKNVQIIMLTGYTTEIHAVSDPIYIRTSP